MWERGVRGSETLWEMGTRVPGQDVEDGTERGFSFTGIPSAFPSMSSPIKVSYPQPHASVRVRLKSKPKSGIQGELQGCSGSRSSSPCTSPGSVRAGGGRRQADRQTRHRLTGERGESRHTAGTREVGSPGGRPSSVTDMLCDIRQVPSLLWASVSPLCNKGWSLNIQSCNSDLAPYPCWLSEIPLYLILSLPQRFASNSEATRAVISQRQVV